MDKQLLAFAIKRFLLIATIAGFLLIGLSWLQGESLVQALIWALLSALAATGIASWWGYKRRCRLVYPDRNGTDGSQSR